MYLSRELTDATLPAIGKAFGRNHTTVMHACKRTAERIAADREAYEAVRALTLELGGAVTSGGRLTVFAGSAAQLLHRPDFRTERGDSARYAPIHSPYVS